MRLKKSEIIVMIPDSRLREYDWQECDYTVDGEQCCFTMVISGITHVLFTPVRSTIIGAEVPK